MCGHLWTDGYYVSAGSREVGDTAPEGWLGQARAASAKACGVRVESWKTRIVATEPSIHAYAVPRRSGARRP